MLIIIAATGSGLVPTLVEVRRQWHNGQRHLMGTATACAAALSQFLRGYSSTRGAEPMCEGRPRRGSTLTPRVNPWVPPTPSHAVPLRSAITS